MAITMSTRSSMLSLFCLTRLLLLSPTTVAVAQPQPSALPGTSSSAAQPFIPINEISTNAPAVMPTAKLAATASPSLSPVASTAPPSITTVETTTPPTASSTQFPTSRPSMATVETSMPFIPIDDATQKTNAPMPTDAPDTPKPTNGMDDRTSLEGIVLTLVGITQEISSEKKFAAVVNDWFDSYYNDRTKRQPRKRALQIDSVQNMLSAIQVTGQELDGINNSLKVTYRQEMRYARSGAVSAEDLAATPYRDPKSNQALVQALQTNVPGLESLQGPIETPEFEGKRNQVADLVDAATKGLSIGAVAGIVVAILALCACCGIITGCCLCGRRRRRAEQGKLSSNSASSSSSPTPPLYINGSHDSAYDGGAGKQDMHLAIPNGHHDDVSAMGGDSELFGNQSSIWDAATVANTRIPSKREDFAMNFQPGPGERVVLVDAPRGPLGLVIDKDDEGTGLPFIAMVKNASVLRGQVKEGDRLAGLDGDDVRHMSIAEITQKILNKNDNDVRQLMLVRTVEP